MRVIKAEAQNFASYKELEFNFSNAGLCLIQGATGAGKSTLCDLLPWVLFGVTAKDGTADEIRAWNSNEDTTGKVSVYVKDQVITVMRTRGKNDLLYTVDGTTKRGKDLKDTQKQINELLGMTAETYLAGAYFHEFSKTASFFITTAKNRREICEQIVDLSFVKKLQERISTESKAVTDKIKKHSDVLSRLEAQIDKTSETIIYLTEKQKSFELDKNKELNTLTVEQEKKSIQLTEIASKHILLEEKLKHNSGCPTCGAKNDKLTREYHEVNSALNLLKNTYARLQEQYTIAKNRKNTYDKDLEVYETKYLNLIKDQESAEALLQKYYREDLDLELLKSSIETLRKIQIEDTIGFIQDNTNKYLSEYFDAEIKVEFDVSNSDKIEVLIYKDGNACSYTQLSKGQRGLLKLCFGISIMTAVSNKSGIQFNSIFFDEALDGLDDNLKVRCYRLMQNLALNYENVFMVEHNQSLKTMFEKSYIVTLQDGESRIEEST